jgi:hypothetical protein
MISHKFYSQIATCPACQGWGQTKSPPTKLGDACGECMGKGVTLLNSSELYIWDAPTFVDYKGRDKVLVLKIVALFLAMFIFLIFIVIIRNMIGGIFN